MCRVSRLSSAAHQIQTSQTTIQQIHSLLSRAWDCGALKSPPPVAFIPRSGGPRESSSGSRDGPLQPSRRGGPRRRRRRWRWRPAPRRPVGSVASSAFAAGGRRRGTSSPSSYPPPSGALSPPNIVPPPRHVPLLPTSTMARRSISVAELCSGITRARPPRAPRALAARRCRPSLEAGGGPTSRGPCGGGGGECSACAAGRPHHRHRHPDVCTPTAGALPPFIRRLHRWQKGGGGRSAPRDAAGLGGGGGGWGGRGGGGAGGRERGGGYGGGAEGESRGERGGGVAP